MCSISGLFYFDSERLVDKSVLTAMRSVATHRGPDDHGVYCNGNVGFGFNRLSIIDVAAGHQPMSNDRGTAWIVFNGEIYNFQDLSQVLSQAGHQFRTRSDTEAVLRAWEEYGEKCVDHLRGMFAFAIWDDSRKTLFAARDRIGIKPFYYYTDGEMFAFASEIKSLLELSEVPREVDTTALADYLRHGYALPPHTLFRKIRTLAPGHTMTVSQRGISIQQYWDIPLEPSRTINEKEALEQLSPLLDDTVRMHLMSDVPLGVFLSGGIDSSTVVAVMSRLGVRKIQTFSIGYDSAESELDYARIVAQHYATEHHEVRLTPSDFSDRLPSIVWHMDEPVADAPSIPFYFLSEFASKKVTVALSGEGADEIFGGYPTYRRMLLFDNLNRLPLARQLGRAFERWAPAGKLRKNGAMLGQNLESRYRSALIFSFEEIRRLLLDTPQSEDPYQALEPVRAKCRNLDSLARMSYIDLKTWMPNDLLLKADRLSMAHSLELRVPFLDHKLVEFAAGLPLNLKIRRNINKYILKRLVEPLLPARIVHRPKRGFPIPTKVWFRTGLAGFARERLLATDSPCSAFLSRKEVEGVLEAHRYRDCSDQIYALLVFDEWHRTFIKSKPPRRESPAATTMQTR
jgi:asparagine synthase (glutamine-hydrolysing)